MFIKKKWAHLSVFILFFTTTGVIAGLLDLPEKLWNAAGDYRDGQNAIKELPVLK